MLTSLTIQNYALISQLEIDFSRGFSVVTGETGAGKSIVLGALSLILGQRADVKAIQSGENKCLIEGVFDISLYQLQTYFEERDLEYDEKQCVLRRELWASGKSRAFINDTPVGLNDLKELGSRLIDIHSQHQNLMLGDRSFQLLVLDALADNNEIKASYKKVFQHYNLLQKQFRSLKEDAEKSAADEDYFQYQYNQLKEAAFQPGEQQLLESEVETLSHMEEIKGGLFQVDQLLSGDGQSAVQALKSSLDAVQSLIKVYPPAVEMADRLRSVYLDVKDLALEVSSCQEDLEFNPERLQFVTERLDLLYSLQQKHKADSTEALIALQDDIAKRLQVIGHFEEELEKIQGELNDSYTELLCLGELVTESRRQAAQRLEVELVDKVKGLGMPHMRFTCEFLSRPTPDSTGMDDVQFLFSANKNSPLKPVASIASGGEISRLMLGVKALIAGAMALPTIIFDEIDTGVSGEIADKMGNIMQELGRVMQVIVITHLPQIAAQGNVHYFVYKEDSKNTTETHIRQLSEEERIREIALMLSGSELSKAALANAKELLKI